MRKGGLPADGGSDRRFRQRGVDWAARVAGVPARGGVAVRGVQVRAMGGYGFDAARIGGVGRQVQVLAKPRPRLAPGRETLKLWWLGRRRCETLLWGGHQESNFSQRRKVR